MNETIVAIATANGVGSIAIVRISGEKALQIAKKLSKKDEIKPRYAYLAYISDEEDIIDQVVMLYFKSPNSFTGEDIVEFQCHGGAIVANEILEISLKNGARLAMPGEFSKRAFINGKIDLTQAEAIAKMIEAQSVDAAKILARQLKGSLGTFVDESRELLLLALAHSEVMIDYAEEDLPKDIISSIQNQLNTLELKLENILESSKRRHGLIDGFNVAIIGKPNVGKSSLLNSLLSYDRAIVSDIAGTTRDTIEERIRIGTHIIRLIDTAGIRDTIDEIESIGVKRSLLSLDNADIVIALFDGSREWDEEDDNIADIIKNLDSQKHILIVLNKSDLERKLYNIFLDDYEISSISIKTDSNVLSKKLENILNSISVGDEIMLVSNRQIEAVAKTINFIKDAKKPLLSEELELFSYHLTEAIKSISSISKPYDNEDILDKMFSEFCLGK
ncbi:tRNA modification GTPase MnmE [Sulfurovum sp. enrichment culture clone C5]|uniref:tRNA modification GTPase MnmE n=1 Tax=Sulfurovum sp. enrichment culture clone C5 TaxID=497650 RepID=A0A0S4XPZ9_9BACT|nr:tRNA modification GTPase MnmE [Sulfurovum sp. enrichment culture clone C5]